MNLIVMMNVYYGLAAFAADRIKIHCRPKKRQKCLITIAVNPQSTDIRRNAVVIETDDETRHRYNKPLKRRIPGECLPEAHQQNR